MGTIKLNLFLRKKQTFINEVVHNLSKANWDGQNYILDVIDVTATYASLYGGSVTISNLLYLRNVGVNDVMISFDGGVTNQLLLKSGEPQLIRLCPDYPITSIKAIAPTGNSILEYLHLEGVE